MVAAEVRNLAQRSATAAKESKALIQDSVAKVQGGSELVNQSGRTLEEIVTAVKGMTDIIAEMAAASQEQSQGIDQVNKAVTQMDQLTQSNAAQTLAAQANQVKALVGRCKLDHGIAAQNPVAVTPVPKSAARPRTPASVSKTLPHKVKLTLAGTRAQNGAAHSTDADYEEF